MKNIRNINNEQIGIVNNTLGLRIKFIKEWYCKKCEEIKINKKINKIIKICIL